MTATPEAITMLWRQPPQKTPVRPGWSPQVHVDAHAEANRPAVNWRALRDWLDVTERVQRVLLVAFSELEPTFETVGSYVARIAHEDEQRKPASVARVRALEARVAYLEDLATKLLMDAPERKRLRGGIFDELVSGSMTTTRHEARRLVTPAVDLDRLQQVFAVENEDALKRRLLEHPELHIKLLGAAAEIAKRFVGGALPRLAVEADGRLILRIPTKMDASQVQPIMDALRREWWLQNVGVEDRMTLALTFV